MMLSIRLFVCLFLRLSPFYRATRMHSADHYAVARCPSVCLSVRMSHAGIESKRLSLKFFHHLVAPPL